MPSTREYPLVTSIMPTYNRRTTIQNAIACFLRQDYPHKELVILDDGSDPVGDLVPADTRIRYIRLEHKLALGDKLNQACELAQGEIIAHWDDDDWCAPHRLSYQVGALLESGLDVVGLNTLLYYDLDNQRGWQFVWPAEQRFWMAGGSLVYHRVVWNSHRFQSVKIGSDSSFIRKIRPERMGVLPDYTIYVGLIHKTNTSPKMTAGAYWHPYPVEKIRRLTGPGWPAASAGEKEETCP